MAIQNQLQRAVLISAPAMNASLEPALNGKVQVTEINTACEQADNRHEQVAYNRVYQRCESSPIIIPIARSIMLPLNAKL